MEILLRFFIQKRGTNETQHIYFGGRRKTTFGTQHNITLFSLTVYNWENNISIIMEIFKEMSY